MPDEKAPSLGAFLPSSLMHHLSGEPMHDLSGVDSCRQQARCSLSIPDKNMARRKDRNTLTKKIE
jgi:hypothetical protein